MGDPLNVAWPVPPIRTTRLVVRPTAEGDRPGRVDLLCSPEVRHFLGGPLDRASVEQNWPEALPDPPGAFAVERRDEFIGTVMVDRRPLSRPGHLGNDRTEVEISYTFLPHAWGQGYAGEAVEAVLQWIDDVLPGESVVVCTQVVNHASVRLAERLGFEEVSRFEEFGADQWFGVRASSSQGVAKQRV